MKILILGMRCNAAERPQWNDLENWLKVMKGVRAFADEPSRQRLLSIGLETWDAERDCYNLLPPAPQVIRWDAEMASKVAAHLNEHELEKYDRVFLVGRAVAQAFGVGAWNFFMPEGGVMVLPHPSGLNRWWNNDFGAEKARKYVEDFLR